VPYKVKDFPPAPRPTPPGRKPWAESQKMSESQNWPNARTIVLTILAMIAAAALTIEGVYLVLNAFVLHDLRVTR